MFPVHRHVVFIKWRQGNAPLSMIGYVTLSNRLQINRGFQVSKTETIILCLTTLFFWGNSSVNEVLDLFFFPQPFFFKKLCFNVVFKMFPSVIIFSLIFFFHRLLHLSKSHMSSMRHMGFIHTLKSNKSNTRRSISSEIQTLRSNISNTRRSVSSDIQTSRSNW